MRLIYLFVLLLCNPLFATTYYVKYSGGTGSGLNDANAWSFAKLLATNINPGDSVLFKRGDLFTGTLGVLGAGLPSAYIYYGAYGSGGDPVISGFATLSSWTLQSGNVYYTTLDVPMLNIVTVNGEIKRMGRYPNSGYLPLTSHTGNTSITGTSIGAIPFNPSGAELVQRKNRWIIDRNPITSRVSNTLNYSSGTYYGHSDLYDAVDNNGYFIQNHLSTLDSLGEWYYDTTANRLYMHFGAGTPAGVTVKAGSTIQNLYLNYYGYFTFSNITFEGGNQYGAYVIGTSNIRFNNCTFRQQGGTAIWASFTPKFTVINGTITDALNNGIWMEQNGDTTLIDGVLIRNVGMIAGGGRSGNGNQEGIEISGNNTTVQNCQLSNIGYHGIHYDGNNVLIQKNIIDSTSMVKDDGAGIYEFTGVGGGTKSNRVVKNNVVKNSIGTFAGAEGYYYEPFGKAAGIYLDDYSNHTLVDSNIITTGNWYGIFLHNASNNQVTNNRVTNFATQIAFSQDVASGIRSNTTSGNTFTANTSDQRGLFMEVSFADNIALFSSFNNNRYSKPSNNNVVTRNLNYGGGGGESSYTLSDWKTLYGLESGSISNPKLGKSGGKILKRNGKIAIISY